ncbi:extracellular matrix regulator RemB [Heyndrickxia coagulans]|uniref:extracellular matrix regulator RemB n=1 Tax=Heyndrickxia coagulans TaxID=1398 RepID=UPI000779D6E9|nr:extracellular matrix/biofilm biosynthesis regulator RemA family protein [Heyndrickxia coagulans]KYC88394.1 hypothetical protein B4096_1336 [Heyndrickxia coagulans]
MYLHLAEDVMIRSDDIIAIMDERSLNSSGINKAYLQAFKKATVNLAKGSFKSAVITQNAVYLSPFSPGILFKRAIDLFPAGFLTEHFTGKPV